MLERTRIPRLRESALSRSRAGRAWANCGAFFAVLAFGTMPFAAQAPPAPAQHFVVVIDAAHGGDDAGARLSGEMEKAYTLALSVRLRSLLMARGMSVVTTRESDTTLDADHRAEIANHADAEACLSLHASETGAGVHLFLSSLAPLPRTTFLPWKTAQAAWMTRSVALAGVFNSALNQAGIPVTLGRIALPGIDSMTCPAVAIEVAPQAKAGESGSANLDDSDYQARVAEALAAALVEWRASDKGGHQP